MFCNDSPGPGQYFKDKSHVSSLGGKAYSFSGKPRAIADPDTPGPDRYNSLKSSFGGAPSWSMTAKPPKYVQESTPGPGDYKTELHNALGNIKAGAPLYSMACKLPQQKTLNMDPSEPGPAYYNPLESFHKVKTRAPTYVCGQRTKARAPDEVPGPNAYHKGKVPSTLGGGPAFSFKGKYHQKDEVDIRKPQYQINPRPTGAPKFSMAKKLAGNTSQFYTSGNAPILALGPTRRALVQDLRTRSRALAAGHKPAPHLTPRLF